MKKTALIILGVIVLLGGSVYLSKNLQKNDPNLISKNGLHWHANLEIFSKGVKQEIPINIGVGTSSAGKPTFESGMQMTAIHTHETDGTIHMEFSGLVKKQDTKLGNLFEIWNKDFKSFGENVTMSVNDATSTEYESYEMKDGDRIVLKYE